MAQLIGHSLLIYTPTGGERSEPQMSPASEPEPLTLREPMSGSAPDQSDLG